ncbi:hypothetical protein B0H67DRAFT_572241 [Lasiosphaeris hirsuta]|uniref:Secreted protein n=1 Tax=Lasiosphaeris hirsuta TaxID=260670 RepID=A0AA40E879_9PEZI|nr:hypothetical protein B0H67DRAFT_572241 [Lasiosphaeris hirsuta]
MCTDRVRCRAGLIVYRAALMLLLSSANVDSAARIQERSECWATVHGLGRCLASADGHLGPRPCMTAVPGCCCSGAVFSAALSVVSKFLFIRCL